jgi:hypothetical protein
MAIAASGPSPIDESLQVARSDRISKLSEIVFGLAPERFLGGTNHEYDDVEPAGLIAALRACGYYMIPRAAFTKDDGKIVQIKGNDGNHYIAEFSIRDPSIVVHVARIHLASLSLDPDPEPLAGPGFRMREIQIVDRMDVIPEYSMRLNLGSVTADRAFLIAMSVVISFMDDQDDDPDEDARLAPLTALVRPTDDELREIWAKKLPPSSINYDDEVDMPY